MQHVATRYTGDVQECEEVWQEWHRVFVCKVCRAGGRNAADEFHFEDVKLACVYEFVYLDDMWNDKGRVEQAVAARVKAAWMKFRMVEYCVREWCL